jgi:hypothetical protein
VIQLFLEKKLKAEDTLKYSYSVLIRIRAVHDGSMKHMLGKQTRIQR